MNLLGRYCPYLSEFLFHDSKSWLHQWRVAGSGWWHFWDLEVLHVWIVSLEFDSNWFSFVISSNSRSKLSVTWPLSVYASTGDIFLPFLTFLPFFPPLTLPLSGWSLDQRIIDDLSANKVRLNSGLGNRLIVYVRQLLHSIFYF